MQFTHTEEQDILRNTVQEFLERHSPIGAARERVETGETYDAVVWQRLADELQLLALHVPEDAGGHGFGYVELGIVLEEMGRLLYPGPFLATAGLAIPLLLAADSHGELLERALNGTTIVTVALTAGVASTAGPVLSGTLPHVLNGADADVVLVAADGSLFAVATTTAGVEVEAVDAMDATRPVARITLTDAAAELVGDADAFATALPMMRACLAAELLGVADRSLEIVVAYVGDRQQFGAPVGSFQAVQHQCADLFVAVEEARSAVYHALWAASVGDPELELSSAIALAVSLSAAAKVTRSSIQLHGGIGFTWEHDAHLYFKRAVAAPALLGSFAELRRLVAEISFQAAPV